MAVVVFLLIDRGCDSTQLGGRPCQAGLYQRFFSEGLNALECNWATELSLKLHSESNFHMLTQLAVTANWGDKDPPDYCIGPGVGRILLK